MIFFYLIIFGFHIHFILINFIKYHDLYTGSTSTGFINKGHELHGFLLLWAFIPRGSN